MRRSLHSIASIAALGVLLVARVNAEPSAEADPALALMRRSGIYAQLGSLAPSIEAQMQTQYGAMPLATRAALIKAMRESYAAEPLREAVRAHLRAHLDLQHLRAVNAWLDSPQGRRLTQLEEEAATPEAVRKVQAFAASLQLQPPDVDRISLMQDLDRAYGSSELGTEVALKTAFAVARGLSAANGNPASAASVNAAIDAQRATVRATMEQSTLVSMLYTYQSLSAAQVGEFTAFMKSPAGSWYRQAMQSALISALDRANVGLEARLGRSNGPRPAAPSY